MATVLLLAGACSALVGLYLYYKRSRMLESELGSLQGNFHNAVITEATGLGYLQWQCRYLQPEWELLFPHVRQMDDKRKYSEWITFVANHGTFGDVTEALTNA